ncbi:DUF881 domain-containing protein [uncultured Bifidobacterium sp.]|uniref:DUF881 domain-containing protein n=1 Tax=uncultured Bifidobacterium sp. TaxID=165187 RepID=UPI00261E9E71|nr:DUF881 domain-containing protein [uncultured Bifidobacterium sp.]
MTTGIGPEPISLPVEPDRALLRRRAVFSSQAVNLGPHHIADPETVSGTTSAPRRHAHDYSLRLIDDLTNRSVDPMFVDSLLVSTQRRSPLIVWSTRLVVMLICVGVGLFGSAFVRQLNTDPRKEVRASLAKELEEQKGEFDDLSSQVTKLRSQVDAQSKKLGTSSQSTTLSQDELVNGLVAVTGEGITLTIADPLAASNETSSTRGGTSQLRVVTDTDLQTFVSILWKAGAEAISVNGYRIGVQTSIRRAGQTILVGVNGVQSPYTIRAIGNKTTLAKAVGSKSLASLYADLASAGITPHVDKSSSLSMDAAGSGDITYATKGD